MGTSAGSIVQDKFMCAGNARGKMQGDVTKVTKFPGMGKVPAAVGKNPTGQPDYLRHGDFSMAIRDDGTQKSVLELRINSKILLCSPHRQVAERTASRILQSHRAVSAA